MVARLVGLVRTARVRHRPGRKSPCRGGGSGDVPRFEERQSQEPEDSFHGRCSQCQKKQLVLAVLDNELAADDAAQSLKDTGAVDGDAVGILVLDAAGKLKVDKVGARSTGKGAGIGGVLLLLGPAAVGVGVLGGGGRRRTSPQRLGARRC